MASVWGGWFDWLAIGVYESIYDCMHGTYGDLDWGWWTLNVNNVRRDVIMNKSIYLSEISPFVVSDGVMTRS